MTKTNMKGNEEMKIYEFVTNHAESGLVQAPDFAGAEEAAKQVIAREKRNGNLHDSSTIESLKIIGEVGEIND